MHVQNIQKFFLERSVLNAQMTAGHFWMIPFIELCIDIPKVDGAVLINELVRPHLEFVIECTDRTAIRSRFARRRANCSVIFSPDSV